MQNAIRHVLSFLAVLAALAGAGMAEARNERIDGPVKAEIVRVIDGDTILVSASPWPEHRIETYVRLRGIDAPELKSQCPTIRLAGEEAAAELAHMLAGTSEVLLFAISGDKYYGRVVADIRLADGRSLANELLAAGLARPYQGGHKPQASCQN